MIINNIYKEQYVKDITAWLSKVNISLKNRKDHSEIIKKHFPITEKSLKDENIRTLSVQNEKCFVEYDCCISACMVFVGDHRNSLYCIKCGASRYLPCQKCTNIGKDCTKKQTSICSHHTLNSTPRRTIRYRSITMLLIQLLQFDSFLEVIKYKFSDEDPEK